MAKNERGDTEPHLKREANKAKKRMEQGLFCEDGDAECLERSGSVSKGKVSGAGRGRRYEKGNA